MRRIKVLLFVLSFMLGGTLFAQTNVRGTISDAQGETLPGVNILEVGTTNGTISDINGAYLLQVTGSESVLEYSYIGFETQRVSVRNQVIINITLTLGAQRLDEVVVTALGFTVKKDESAQVSSSVGGEDIVNSGEAMLLNSLGSRASNVQISRSNGDPGAGTTIRIRGANTIEGSSNPLIILDGVPINNSTVYGGGNNISGGTDAGTSQQSRLNDINPNDIESVEILKGAAAASLWGSRAANGVLVITTKSGKPGKLTINYKSTYSFDQVNKRYPIQKIYGQGRDGVYSPTRSESWGDYIPDRIGGDDVFDETGQYFEAKNGTKYYPLLTKNSKENFVEENWDAAFQTGGFWQNDLSISGGSDKTQYFFSLGNIDQKGIIRNSDYNRTNARLNVKYYPNKWLNTSTKASYMHSSSNRIQQSSNTTGLLLGLLRNPPDFDVRDYIGTYYENNGTAHTNAHRAFRKYMGDGVPAYNNPLWTIWEQVATSVVDRFIMSQEINLTPVEWLRLTARGGVDRSDDNRVWFFPVNSGGSGRRDGRFAEDMIRIQEVNLDVLGTGNFNLTDQVTLSATLGWNFNDRQYYRNSGDIEGFLVDSRKQTTDLNTASENSVYENFKTHRQSNRGYYVFNFSLFDQLYVNASGGLEASSTILGNFFYPAFDVAWKFLDNISSDIFSFGKFRASWGKVGVQPVPHMFETTVEGGFTYYGYSSFLDINLFGGGFRLNDDIGNPNLKPEMKTEWEIGADLRFFQDKLSLSATYYQNTIEDILIWVGLSPSSGFDTQYANAASMENKGFEMDMDYSIIQNKDFNVNAYMLWSTNKNEVTGLAGTASISLAPGSVNSRAVVGEALGVLYGTGSQVDDNGDLLLDANGFPQITSSPVKLGDPNPDWTGSIGVRANWKGLGFNIMFAHSQGGDFSPRTLWVLNRFGTTEESAGRVTLTNDLVNYDGDVTLAGETVRGTIKDFGSGNVLLDEAWYRHGIGGGFGDNQAYNFSIYDATWTRLKEVSLSYTLNSAKFREKTKLGSVVFTASGRNLFIWDGIPGVDPEINQSGVNNGFGLDYFTNPSTRSFLFSLSITY
ncbi:MAG: SusC/RagA family TonB-linked outer membrane protein [Bacteroidales bacterium]|nr:SusC/RagA family TonB-linked outer membrane protein [Bacteroidales bacterium]